MLYKKQTAPTRSHVHARSGVQVRWPPPTPEELGAELLYRQSDGPRADVEKKGYTRAVVPPPVMRGGERMSYMNSNEHKGDWSGIALTLQ